jgi:hypothetical protein
MIDQPFVMSDDLNQSFHQKICERWLLTISLREYPNTKKKSCNFLYEIITVRRGFRMFCKRWLPRMLKQRIPLTLMFQGDTTKRKMDFSTTSYEKQVMKAEFHFWVVKSNSSQKREFIYMHQLTNSVELSTTREATSCAATW